MLQLAITGDTIQNQTNTNTNHNSKQQHLQCLTSYCFFNLPLFIPRYKYCGYKYTDGIHSGPASWVSFSASLSQCLWSDNQDSSITASQARHANVEFMGPALHSNKIIITLGNNNNFTSACTVQTVPPPSLGLELNYFRSTSSFRVFVYLFCLLFRCLCQDGRLSKCF